MNLRSTHIWYFMYGRIICEHRNLRLTWQFFRVPYHHERTQTWKVHGAVQGHRHGEYGLLTLCVGLIGRQAPTKGNGTLRNRSASIRSTRRKIHVIVRDLSPPEFRRELSMAMEKFQQLLTLLLTEQESDGARALRTSGGRV